MFEHYVCIEGRSSIMVEKKFTILIALWIVDKIILVVMFFLFN